MVNRLHLNHLRRHLEYHLVDSTAISATSAPLAAAVETFAIGMAPEISVNARIIGTALAYAGLGTIISKGRDAWRKAFKINHDTSEKIQHVYDAAYSVAFNSVFCPLFYYASGSRDLKEIALATGVGMVMGVVTGGPTGYVIDTYRDLTGLRPSPRIHRSMKHRHPHIKKGLAALLTAGSIALTAGVYDMAYHIHPKKTIPSIIPTEQVQTDSTRQTDFYN